MKLFLNAFLVLIVASCSTGYGSKLSSEKLDVYFQDKSLSSYADSLGAHWTKSGLLNDKKQSIFLLKDQKGYGVKIIAEKGSRSPNLRFDERIILEDFRAQLQKDVFKNKPTRLIICDEEFKPIYQLEK